MVDDFSNFLLPANRKKEIENQARAAKLLRRQIDDLKKEYYDGCRDRTRTPEELKALYISFWTLIPQAAAIERANINMKHWDAL